MRCARLIVCCLHAARNSQALGRRPGLTFPDETASQKYTFVRAPQQTGRYGRTMPRPPLPHRAPHRCARNKISVFWNAFKQCAGTHAAKLIPPHVGKTVGRRPAPKPSAGIAPARRHQSLHRSKRTLLVTQANAKQGNAARDGVAQRLYQRALGERTHQRAKMSDAGENQRVARRESFRRRRTARFDTEPRERALDRRKIPAPYSTSAIFIVGLSCWEECALIADRVWRRIAARGRTP